MNNNLQNKIFKAFEERYTGTPLMIKSPGRINLIGEHTDYNDGFVFPATIDKYIYVAIAKSGKSYSSAYSIDFDESIVIDLNKLVKTEKGSWKNYVIGVVAGIVEKTNLQDNFNLVFGGDIPIGAGLSSSAALENGIVYGLNKLFDLELDSNEMMNISIEAEHNFAGVNCGIMDQFSNLHGKKDNAILLDCADLSYKHIPIQLDKYSLLLINTNVKHQLSDSPYNQRKQACKTGFETIKKHYPAISSLSRATIEQLDSVKSGVTEEVYNRCLYVIEENARVLKAKKAMEQRDWKELGKQLFDSHKGLSELYEVSCDELDFLVDLAKQEQGVLGSRMMGGGFGGCTINLIETISIDRFIDKVKFEYREKYGHYPDFYPVNIVDGIKSIKL